MAKIEEEQVSFTLRLSKNIRDQLIVQSEGKGKSLNAYIQTLLESHLIESGFFGTHLVSLSGRSFEVVFQADDIKDRFDAVGFFFLRELRFDKTRARYMIGLAEELAEDWSIKKEGRTEAIKAIGLALLAFYNRTCEIDRLSWPNPSGQNDFDGFRLLTAQDVAPINSLPEFLERLRKNEWQDRLLGETTESQDVRRGRSRANLHR